MAQICAECFYEDDAKIYNVNGRCDVCSSTSWIDEEDLKLKLTSDEMKYIRNLLDRKSKNIHRDLNLYMPEEERDRQLEVLNFVNTLKFKFVEFIQAHGI